MPFDIYQGEEIIDSGEDYQNAIGWLPNIYDLLYQSEGALCIHGRNFLFKGQNLIRPTNVRWLYPNSVFPKWDQMAGLTHFERVIGGSPKRLELGDIVYTRIPNFFSETDRGRSPVEAALAAAGVILNVDLFASSFFERGAVKATLLTVEGEPQPQERSRLLAWWRRVSSGSKGAWGSDVIAASVKPTIIGEGIKDLSNVELTKEKREDIATALGIPQSLMFSTGGVNRAISQQDDQNLYEKCVIPEARFIERSWNEQMFQPAGYRLVFAPNRLSVFQQDEEMRSGSLVNLVQAGIDLDIAVEILGYDLSEQQMERIAARLVEKAEARAVLRDRLSKGSGKPPKDEAEEDEDEKAEGDSETPEPMKRDLQNWHRKAVRRFRETGSAAVPFLTSNVPASLKAAIDAHLELARSEDEIGVAFADRWMGYP
jgi:hypothetical protein